MSDRISLLESLIAKAKRLGEVAYTPNDKQTDKGRADRLAATRQVEAAIPRWGTKAVKGGDPEKVDLVATCRDGVTLALGRASGWVELWDRKTQRSRTLRADIVTGGTDNHLMLVDLRPKNLTGKAAEAALGRAHITVNKNAVPNDPQSPFVTSGIRVGTPAMTTRGCGVDESRALAGWMCDVLDAIDDERVNARVRAQVEELCGRHPVYAA